MEVKEFMITITDFVNHMKHAQLKDAQNYQKHRVTLIARCKLNQQNIKENRKYQKQTYMHQIEELSESISDLKQAMETLEISV